MLAAEIMDYYRAGGERSRLATGAGLLEYLRTWDVLTRALPPAPADVLDVGGATGVYAGPLTEAGYRVRVVDPVPEHVADAGARPGVTATLGDARALPAVDHSADAVLLLGPLYHLPVRAERLAAWREAARVLRPGGVAVGALISRYSGLLDGLMRGFIHDPSFRRIVDETLASGEHRNLDGGSKWFTTAYFHHPDEVSGEVTEAGLHLERLVSTESPLWMARDSLNDLLADPADRERILDTLRRIEDEPSLLGASSHLLAIARRS
ncbi:class I SAM-dependent methyltransferase [Rugosimonospora acidiphila]